METSSGVDDGITNLPQGGGAVRGLGDRFQPDLLRGSGNFSIPIAAPRGPNDLRPSLSLRYSTGVGNGPLGLGWLLSGPLEIRRRTDRGVPRYDDALDEFVLSGAETLVPVGGGRYRPRADTTFWDVSYDGSTWTVRTKEGRTHVFGPDTASRITGPGGRVLAWLIAHETDAAGNRIVYSYDHDAEQAYLSGVAWSIYELRLGYEQRPDVGHDGRGGFPITTARRLTSIERRCPREPQPVLARHDLIYSQAEGSQLSLLNEVRLTGIDASGNPESFPSVKLRYSGFTPGAATYHRLGAQVVGPPPLDAVGVALVDLNGDGLPDLLATDDSRHRWWPNEGNGDFGPPRTMSQVPAGMVVGRQGVTFADLRGDGAADLVRIDQRLTAAIENTAQGAWGRPRVAARQPLLRLSAAATRVVDLDGDGVSDFLQSTSEGFILTYADGEGSWSRTQVVSAVGDASQFPKVGLDEPGVELADMTGDGLPDLVYVASGRIEYWPYYGRGSWGARVRTRGAPVLPQGFDYKRLFLTDVDGDGLADVLYIDADRVLVWINQSGLAWSDPYEIPFPGPPSVNTVQLCDFLGSGTPGILWSDLDRRADATGYRYLDIGAAGKPYLLEQIDNGLGSLTDIAYETTAALRSADARAGEDWHTYLPFPVHVVSETRLTDRLTGRVQSTEMRYRRGVYDGVEREFRGFAEVEVQTTGDESSPTTIQVTSFDVGSFAGPTDALAATPEEQARQRALCGSPLSVQTVELAPDGTRIPVQSATMSWDARLEFTDSSRYVHFPRMIRLDARDHAPGDPDRIDVADYDHDAYGNLTSKHRSGRFDGQPDSEALVTAQELTYTSNEGAWLVGLPVVTRARDGLGRLLSETRHYYDGPDYEGLAAGDAAAGLLTRTAELALADWALPAGYADSIDPAWGLSHDGEGYYRTTVAYARDAAGNVTAQKDGLGAAQTIDYDSDSLFPIRRHDSLGLVTEADFDVRSGQPLAVRLPNGTVTCYSYSPIGRLRGQSDTVSDGSVQLTQVFDVDYGDYAAEPIKPSRALSLRITKSGHALADFTELTDLDTLADADIAVDYYDANGKRVQQLRRGPSTTDPSRRWIVKQRRDWTIVGPAADYPNQFVADAGFQRALPSDPAVRFSYGGGRLVLVEQPDGGRIRMSYGSSIRRRWMPNMQDADVPISELHDAWGRLVGVDEPIDAGTQASTRYKLDETDRPLEITDASGRVSARYVYGGPGPAIRIEHADAGQRTSWFDATGRLRVRRDSLGRELRLNYDGEGRMTEAIDATDPANPQTVRSLTYDGARLTRLQDGTVDERFTYDAAGRVASSTLDAGGHPLTTQREYGPAALLSAVVLPDGTRVTYEYDDALALKSIDGYVEAIDYDPYGSPEQIRLTGGASTSYVHEPLMRRLESATLETAVGPIRRIVLGYDVAGRITSWLDDLAGTTIARAFSYDAANRLTRAIMHQGGVGGSLLRDDQYTYTPAGDLLHNDESLTGDYLYGDAARDGLVTQVQHAGAAAPSVINYDAAGRPNAFGDLHDLSYDVWDRLTAATLADGSTVRFAYDHNGQRLRKTVARAGGEEITHYAEGVFESGPEGMRANILAGKLPVAIRLVPAATGIPTVLTILTDHLGSVIASCNSDGTMVQQQIYSPYGLSLRTATDQDAFTGVRADSELGLAQFGARYYAPSLGRFITPDWWVIENPSRALPFPQSLNAFGYAVGNPLTFRDPTGLWFGIDDLIAAAVGFVVGFIAGTIYGLATGQGWNSLLVGLEAGLCGAAGAWLAWNTAGLALGVLGVSSSGTAGTAIMVGAAIAGGFNGVVSGMTQIYDWTSPVGWLSFVSDSSWGLLGTTLGDLVIMANVFYGGGAKYRDDLSRRQNRHVYDGGFGFGNYAFTEGNVTSNLKGRGNTNLLDHETLHITQNRIFGPIFTLSYIAWLVVGGVVGFTIGLFLKQSLGQSIEDVGYNDNPWENWAYDVGGSSSGGTLSWN